MRQIFLTCLAILISGKRPLSQDAQRIFNILKKRLAFANFLCYTINAVTALPSFSFVLRP